MSLIVLIHGAGGSGRHWRLVEAQLRARGHTTVAPDLPVDPSATLTDYAQVVLDAVEVTEQPVVVVGHSYGGFTAPLVAAQLPTAALVYLAGMIPRPGETPAQWWVGTGHAKAIEQQGAQDGGLTGAADPYVCYYHDVPRHLAAADLAAEREHPSPAADTQPWPRHHLPAVPSYVVLGTQDRVFPAPFMRRLAAERLGLVADEIESGHCPALSHPEELAARLAGYADTMTGARTRIPSGRRW